jgi:hypothetical protein
MSLMNTRPRYCPTAVATESGWMNPVTKELLVSVGGLKSKLAIEEAAKVVAIKVADVIQPIEEIKMENPVEVKVRKQYAPRKPKVIGEVTESQVPDNMQLLGEVVEYDLDKDNG